MSGTRREIEFEAPETGTDTKRLLKAVGSSSSSAQSDSSKSAAKKPKTMADLHEEIQQLRAELAEKDLAMAGLSTKNTMLNDQLMAASVELAETGPARKADKKVEKPDPWH